MSCGVGHRRSLDPTLLWLWHRLAATALIRPLAWEPPYAAGVALEKAKTHTHTKTCTHMFIAALITIAKTQKQPKCPLADEWIKKMWYMYTMECYTAIKKNKVMPFAQHGWN